MDRVTRSDWRELQLLLDLVGRAVLPALSLKVCLAHWYEVSYRLREPPRRRAGQLPTLRWRLLHPE